MKRKIRRKRQIRLQKLKRQRVLDIFDLNSLYEQILEEKVTNHPYYHLSDDQHYAFIYLVFHYGMEFFEPKIIFFLYDRMSNKIEYGRCINTVVENSEKNEIERRYEVFGNEIIKENVFIDDMFDCHPPLLKMVLDDSRYELYIKSGQRKRIVNIKSSNKSKYLPYQWLFDLFHRIVDIQKVAFKNLYYDCREK